MTEPKYLDLIVKYREADPYAISLVDTALSIAMDTAFIRGGNDDRVEWLDYNDERFMIDQTTDTLLELMTYLNIKPPIVDYLDILEKENEEA